MHSFVPGFLKLAFVATAVAMTPAALALPQAPWTDPSNRFTISFAELGWTEIEPRSNEPGLLLAIEHRQFQEGGLMRTCYVTERSQVVGAASTQARVNALTASRVEQSLARTVGSQPTRSEHLDVDGVTVVDATFLTPLHQHMRVFYLKRGAELAQILISCGTTDPVPADVNDNVDSLMRSLHFLPE